MLCACFRDADTDAPKKVYVPSSTFQMVQEDEMVKPPPATFTPAIYKPPSAAPRTSLSPVTGSKPRSTSPTVQPVIVGAVVPGTAALHSTTFQKLQQHLE